MRRRRCSGARVGEVRRKAAREAAVAAGYAARGR